MAEGRSSSLGGRLGGLGWESTELDALIRLTELFVSLDEPPDPQGLYPRFAELQRALQTSLGDGTGEEIEERLLALYEHLHGHEAPYTAAERARVDASGGYWAHAGGLSPILRAGRFIEPTTRSADFGAGNGLQGLLIQRLFPHRSTRQIEISSRLVDAGRSLAGWIGVERHAIEWIVGDVLDHEPRDLDFVYLYRPVRPEGPGRAFYARFAQALDEGPGPRTVFSVADPLRPFLGPRFEVVYDDGQLTCYRRD